jgi:hypothetical protein
LQPVPLRLSTVPSSFRTLSSLAVLSTSSRAYNRDSTGLFCVLTAFSLCCSRRLCRRRSTTRCHPHHPLSRRQRVGAVDKQVQRVAQEIAFSERQQALDAVFGSTRPSRRSSIRWLDAARREERRRLVRPYVGGRQQRGATRESRQQQQRPCSARCSSPRCRRVVPTRRGGRRRGG